MKAIDKSKLLKKTLFECSALTFSVLIVYLSIYSADTRLLKIWIWGFCITFISLITFNSINNNPYLDDMWFNIKLSILGPLTLMTIFSTLIVYIIKVYRNEKHEKINSEKND
jgi:hypothetical protein